MRRYLIRIMAGWAFWLALLAIYFGTHGSAHFAPRPVRQLAYTLDMVVAVATWPVVGIGTLLFDWQTGPQPEPWVTGMPFNVVVGLTIYGVLGLVVGALYSWWRRRKVSSDSCLLTTEPDQRK
jgi:hypothetical protein